MTSTTATDSPARDSITLQTFSRLGRRLAHELNNPLSAITSSIYLIQDLASAGAQVDATEIEPFLKSIQEECNHMKETVQEFSRFASTNSILPARIDLSEFLRKRAEEMERDGMPVKAIVPSNQVFSDADTGALSCVLRPLAESALQAGATEVTISLSSNSTNDITISDNRSPQPDMEELSSSFSSDATLERRRGLGLKLPLARRIIELHAGSIEFPSSNNGKTNTLIRIPQAPSNS